MTLLQLLVLGGVDGEGNRAEHTVDLVFKEAFETADKRLFVGVRDHEEKLGVALVDFFHGEIDEIIGEWVADCGYDHPDGSGASFREGACCEAWSVSELAHGVVDPRLCFRRDFRGKRMIVQIEGNERFRHMYMPGNVLDCNFHPRIS